MKSIKLITRYSVQWFCFQVILFSVNCFLAIIGASVAMAIDPGELNVYQPAKFKGQLDLNFRYCPAGTIRPGKPQFNVEGKGLRKPVRVSDFYMGQSEVTLSEFRAIMGEERIEVIQQLCQQLTSSIPNLPTMVKNGQQEPAFLVNLEDAVDYCLKLQQLYDEEQILLKQHTIEARLFRLPSHIEWQYAARAIPNADRQQERPHFATWIQVADLSNANQEKCNELWKKIGQSGPFPGDQNSFLVLSAVSDPSDLQSLKDIYLEAFMKAFHSEASRTASGMVDMKQGLPAVGQAVSNAWNIADIHEGVSEWSIWANTSSSQRSLWTSISQKRKRGSKLEGQNSIFLCGGGLSESYYQRHQINRFTVWGGPTLRESNNWDPEPFTYQRDVQNQPFDHVIEYLPGFRVVMERVLADEWLLVLRRDYFDRHKISENAASQILSAQKLAETLVEKEHPVFQILEFYASLAESNPANRTEMLKRAIIVAKQNSSETESTSNSAKNRIAALLNKSKSKKNTSNDSPKLSDEQLYFQMLDSIVRSDP